MDGCSVANNTGFGGGGLNLYFSPSVSLTNSEVAHNVASGGGDGGGIFCWGTTLTLLGTRVVGNRALAPSQGGAVEFTGRGGGVFNFGGKKKKSGQADSPFGLALIGASLALDVRRHRHQPSGPRTCAVCHHALAYAAARQCS